MESHLPRPREGRWESPDSQERTGKPIFWRGISGLVVEVPYKVGALAAWMSAAVGLGGVAVGISLSPWFNWTSDALSDLGHPRHPSSTAFNAGLIAAGALYMVFVLSLARALPRGRFEVAGEVCLALGGLSLSLIGIINESYGAPHFVVSFTYFMFVPLGMAFVAYALWYSVGTFAWFTLVLSGAGAAFGISIITAILYGAPFSSQAVPELIASAFLAGWSVWAGAMVWGRRFQPAWGHPGGAAPA